jgi:hypothetical protein
MMQKLPLMLNHSMAPKSRAEGNPQPSGRGVEGLTKKFLAFQSES